MNDIKFAPSWVYSLADYCQMFDLKAAELDCTLLDFPAGISSFNAEMSEKGHRVLSGDVMYQRPLQDVLGLAEQIFQNNESHLRKHSDALREDNEQSIQNILSEWERSKQLFLDDYPKGKKEERYKFMELPGLSFPDYSFDIALCSDYLFHSAVQGEDTREAMIEELSRVSKEVRVFPLLDEKGNVTDALGHVMLTFQQRNYGIEIREVPFRHLKGGNAMLRIWSRECVVEG